MNVHKSVYPLGLLLYLDVGVEERVKGRVVLRGSAAEAGEDDHHSDEPDHTKQHDHREPLAYRVRLFLLLTIDRAEGEKEEGGWR